jgi:acyl-CoA hydrolase
MNLRYQTSFIVMPRHANYMYPMIFGGAMFAEMDCAAAACVTRLLHDCPTGCDSAVTHKCDLTFHAAAEVGDLVFIECEVVELRHKSVVVNTKVWREKRAQAGRLFLAEARFVFVTKKEDKFTLHGMKMPDMSWVGPAMLDNRKILLEDSYVMPQRNQLEILQDGPNH